MYKIQDIVRGLRNPKKISRELNRLCHRRGNTWNYNQNGDDFVKEDWDNLLILDACRYDSFVEHSNLSGRTEHRISRGSATYEFVRANFTGKTLHDTVYVGANTWFLKLREEINAEIHDFLDLQSSDSTGDFAVEELNVPSPKAVTEAASEAHERYPTKRLIVHYLQPHHPFIGDKGSEWFTHQSSSLTEVIEHTPGATRKKAREAYSENLHLVLQEVKTLLNVLPGRTVVTADHGEMLGDRHEYVPTRDYGHHEGIYNDVLVKVPWHVIESDSRKEIVAEPPKKLDVNESAVNEQLRDLGYVL